MKKNWKRFLTQTDVIPTDKPIFPLKFLFTLAIIGSTIFYRFVYIYLYPSELGEVLHNYNITHTNQIYIEGFFLTTWVIFITVFIFRISLFLYDKILIPTTKILHILITTGLYNLDKAIAKSYFLLKKNKKTIAPKTSYVKIKKKHKKKI